MIYDGSQMNIVCFQQFVILLLLLRCYIC